MPLHADQKTGARSFDAFDQSVRGIGCGPQTGGQRLDALVVHAVDLYLFAAEQFGEVRSLVHTNWVRQIIARVLVGGGKVIVLNGFGTLGGDVLVETTAAGDVDGLNAAADAEDGFTVRQRPADQQQLRPVAGRVGAVAQLVARLAVVGRIDIDAAGQEHAVELLVNGPERGLVAFQQWNEPRHGAGTGERAHITLA